LARTPSHRHPVFDQTALSIGLVALVLSWLIRLQNWPSRAASPPSAPENYLQFITIHGMIMVIYLLTALFLGGIRELT